MPSKLPSQNLSYTARARLFILVLLLVLPALGVQIYGAWSGLQQALNERKLASAQAVEHAQRDFDALLVETRGVLTDLVHAGELRGSYGCAVIYPELRLALARLTPEATNVALAHADGSVYCSTNPVRADASVSGLVDFQAAQNTRDMALGIYAAGELETAPVLSVSYPVLSSGGSVPTVIVATFGIQWLVDWKNEIFLPSGSAITLIAPNGEVLWRNLSGEAVSLSGILSAAPEVMRAVKAGAYSVESPDFDGITRLNTFAPLGSGDSVAAYLHLGYPVEELYGQAYQNLYWKLLLLGVLFISVLGIAWWGSTTLFLQPLKNLMDVVGRVQAGDLSARVAKVKGLGELAVLAQSFDRMADALQQRELDLRQSEARFRAAFENSGIGMGLISLDGRILAVNAAVCKMSGYTEEELLQRNDSQNVYPEDIDVGRDLFAEMLEGKRVSYSTEKRYVRKNGEVFWVQIVLALVRSAGGQPLYLVGMIEDIDEEKKALAKLQESEASFRAIYENAAIGISLIAPDGRVLAVNPVLEELSGRSASELRELGGQSITYEEDRDVGRQEFSEVLSGKRDHYQVEKRYVHKDGRIHWMKQSVSAVRDETGKVNYLVVIAEDIDERKRAIEELRQSEARFKALFVNSAVGMGLMTLDRKIIAANPAMCEMLGLPEEALIGQTPAMATYPEDYVVSTQLFNQMLSGEIDHYISERRYVHSSGRVFWAQVSMSMVCDSNGKPLYLVGLINNIDAMKQAQARLAAQEAEYRLLLERRIAERTEELNHANELLREKAAQDAVLAERTRLARDLHDAVTQTLFSTTLIAEVLPDIWAINPDEGYRRLDELRQLTRGALAEMRTLLVELRPNALVEVPLPTLLRQLTEAMVGRARIHIQFNVEGECKMPADVQVGLYRIAQEALNNVVKHAGARQAVVTLWMGESVRMTIADDGAGFDPGTVTADHLGLKIMRERAEALGARFSLYSEPGEGTQISVVWS